MNAQPLASWCTSTSRRSGASPTAEAGGSTAAPPPPTTATRSNHSRAAYAESLPDEKGPTCAGFLLRAAAWFAQHGAPVREVITDNAMNYVLSRDFSAAIAAIGAKHRRIRPHCPWQNGKAERFNRTLQNEWAYRRPYTNNNQRTSALAPWLEHYNTHRRHHALAGLPPATRLPVTNVMAEYS